MFLYKNDDCSRENHDCSRENHDCSRENDDFCDRALKELQQTTGLVDTEEVIEGYFTLYSFRVTMNSQVEELAGRVRALEVERYDFERKSR